MATSALEAPFRAPDPIGAHSCFRCDHLALGRVRLGFQGAPLPDVGCDMCPGALWGGVGASMLCSRAFTPAAQCVPCLLAISAGRPPSPPQPHRPGTTKQQIPLVWCPQHRQLVLLAPSVNIQMSLPILRASRHILICMARGALQ